MSGITGDDGPPRGQDGSSPRPEPGAGRPGLGFQEPPRPRRITRKTGSRDLREMQRLIGEIHSGDDAGIREAYDRLQRKLASLRTDKARMNMAVALAAQGMWTPLINHSAAEPSPLVLATIARLLQHCPRADGKEVLSRLLRHRDSRVKSNALDALAFRGDRDHAADARQFLEDLDHRPRAAGLLYLHPIDPESSRIALNALAWSPERLHRATAAFCLSRLLPRDPSLEQLLAELITVETDTDVLQVVLATAASHGQARCERALLELFDGSMDPLHSQLDATLTTLRARRSAGSLSPAASSPAP